MNMGHQHSYNGQCLCGAVSVTVESIDPKAGVCHCGMCRKWGGGPFIAVDCGTAVNFKGEEHITAFQSSEWAERGFCNQCGTHLFYRLIKNQQYIMPADLFDGGPELKLDHEIFIDEKPEYYSFANETRKMTGAEVFANFSAD